MRRAIRRAWMLPIAMARKKPAAMPISSAKRAVLFGLATAVAVARYWKLTNSTEGLSASTRAADISGRSQS